MNESVLSPFHPGEQQVQERVGVRARAESIGSRVIRDHLPDQHAEFYQNLDYLLVGHRDLEGWPWASFLQFGITQDPVQAELDKFTVTDSRNFGFGPGAILPGDPLHNSMAIGLNLGFLGIDLSNRRRNRMAATVVSHEHDHLQLEVQQTFGNCPQYIQTRIPTPIQGWSHKSVVTTESNKLSAADQALVARSDTCFVASYYEGETKDDPAAIGADVSHRGGQPGFVRVDDELTLTIPDYSGNNHFNTLGNIAATGRAGLTFLDFESGDILMLTGAAEILWDEDANFFIGAERLWQFRVTRSIRLKAGLACHYRFDSYSPRSLSTDTWRAAESRLDGGARDEWLPFQVIGLETESQQVKSFYLKPPMSYQFAAGQYLTITNDPEAPENTRTYTISSAPDDGLMRISVKRESAGVVSNWLHDNVAIGDTIEARAPMGSFTQRQDRPAVYVAAGIGITPMIAMIRERALLAATQKGIESMVLFYQAKNFSQLAFADELKSLQQYLGSMLKVVTVLSEPESDFEPGKDFDYRGRLNAEILSSNLRLQNYQFLLCGPSDFMQDMYDEIISLGVSDTAIDAEAFGPSSLQRQSATSEAANVQVAETASIQFMQQEVVKEWTVEDGTLLEFAESQGLEPVSSCRSGKCGSCAVEIEAGKVVYPIEPDYTPGDSEVLLCCAKPAAGTEPLKLNL